MRTGLLHSTYAFCALHYVARHDETWDELLTALIEVNCRVDKRVFFHYRPIDWEAVTKLVRLFFPSVKRDQLYQRWYRTLEPGLIIGKYTDDETKRLRDLASRFGHGDIDWDSIKRTMRRSTKNLRDHYYKYACDRLVRSAFEPAERKVIEDGCIAGHNQKRITDDLNALLRQFPDIARSVGGKHGIEQPMRSVVDVENYLKTLATYTPRSNPGRPGSAKKARHRDVQEALKTGSCDANDSTIVADNLFETFFLDSPDLQDTLDEIDLADWPTLEPDTMQHWFDQEPGPVAPSTHFGVHADLELYAPGSQVPRNASVENEVVHIEPASSGLYADLLHPSVDVDLDYSLDVLLTRIARHHVRVDTSPQ